MVGNEVQISLASKANAETIAKILSEAFAEFDDKYTPEALKYVTPAADEVRRRFAEGPIWLALKNDEIVGTVSVVSEPDRLYIRSMAVSPAAQGHGVGGRLLETIEDYARSSDIDTLFLYTTHFSTDAISLYEKHGFVKGRETTAEEWCGTPGLEMWKYLKKDIKTNAIGS
jgi:ribosomal protein S18 acetylase RimI-like enzyme